MSFPPRSVLVPVDFDGTAPAALATAKQVIEAFEGASPTLHLMHVLSILLMPGEPLANVSMQIGDARKALEQLAKEHLDDIEHQILTPTGETAKAIVQAARDVQADLILMPTHGRRGFSQLFLGSVAQLVVRDAPCPVLTFSAGLTSPPERVVDKVMIKNPPTLTPSDTLAHARDVMEHNDMLSLAVVENENLVGIITDRDLRYHLDELDSTTVSTAMIPGPVTVGPKEDLNSAPTLRLISKLAALFRSSLGPTVTGPGIIAVLTVVLSNSSK